MRATPDTETPPAAPVTVPHLRRMVREAQAAYGTLPSDAIVKAQVCLADVIGCAYEAAHLPWSRQALALALPATPGARILGTNRVVHPGDAAFANAVMGHGLVREDMHAGSICHHGVVVWPALLALADGRAVSGDALLRSAVVAYEAGARIGRALIDGTLARLFRPTGLVSPVGAALGGALMLGLSEDATVNAMALAANTSSGLNQWPHSGSGDMYFHPGFAARNVVLCVLLAREGAQASEDILEGEAGLFRAFRRAAAPDITLFADGRAEILDVYNKPAPACNFAQTACQAALHLAREYGVDALQIAAVDVRVSHAAFTYPGCDFSGPYLRPLQAKMSIQYGVAAVLASGHLAESNYTALDDPSVQHIVDVMRLAPDDAFTQAFPAQQGASVSVRLTDDRLLTRMLPDVVPATPDEVMNRCHAAVAAAIGEAAADRVRAHLDTLPALPDVDRLLEACHGAA